MTRKQILNAAVTATAFGAIVVAGMSLNSPPVRADDGPDSEQVRIQIGFQIAPVRLRFDRSNKTQTNLVGLGSYIVNGAADCNGCHNSPDLGGEFVVPTGMPYFLKPPSTGTIVNKAGYLGGGTDFGPFPSDTPPGAFPHIVSRNLTPDITGTAEGGGTLEQFKKIMRTGKDFDGLHPTCTGAPNGNCLPPPFDGSLLQIMPWPNFGNMSDHDLEAIWAYLNAIPCISHKGSPGLPPNIYQTCPGE